MQKNKFTTYLLYAIGEIILVVIGILIAVGINDWNASRKSERFFEGLISDFEKELTGNVQIANAFIQHGYELDSTLGAYIRIEKEEDVLKLPNGFMFFQTSTRSFISDNLKKLIENENSLPAKYKPIIPEMKELNRRIQSRIGWEKREMELSFQRVQQIMDSQTWLGEPDSIATKEFIAYANDPITKNRIISYYDLRLEENIWDATLLRTTSVGLLWSLKNIRLPEEDHLIEPFLKDLGLKPMTSIACYDFAIHRLENPVNFRRNFIIYNESDDSVAFTNKSKDGSILLDTKKPPKHFSSREFNINADEYITVNGPDSCVTVYYHKEGDYIILR